ncbi:MAG: hypothetical protein WD271_14540 [Acidimicrobiia bacterium]
MPDISATDAFRYFADLLDGVDHRRERYTIVRRGRAVARLEPVSTATGAEIKSLVRRHRPDAAWTKELAELRGRVYREDRC